MYMYIYPKMGKLNFNCEAQKHLEETDMKTK